MWSEMLLKKLTDEIMPLFKEEMIRFNDYLADNPELGSDEFMAVQGYKSILEKHGLTIEAPYGGWETAFKSTFNEGKKNKMALICEYDALPDVGHACGHCGSGVASLWTYLALNKVAEELDVQVDLIGTPDEEVEGAKCSMAENGYFDQYDFVAMCHMGPTSTLEVDFIALRGIIFEFKGKASHAAQAPERGINALNGARLFFDAVDMMRQHIIPEARLHGFISDGGVAANIVPDYACVKYMVRAPKRNDMEYIADWVIDCAKAAALASRTEMTVSKYGDVFYDLSRGYQKMSIMKAAFDKFSIPLVETKGVFVGSSDIGNVDYRCPAFHPVVGIGNEKLIIHSHSFGEAMKTEGAYKGIENSTKVLLGIAFNIYGNNGKLEELNKEWATYREL